VGRSEAASRGAAIEFDFESKDTKEETPMARSERIEIRTHDGTMPAFLALPDGAGPHPAVVVLMEAFGLVPHIEDVSLRLAGEGYVAVAPDVYYRELPDNKVGYDELPKAIGLMQKVNDAKFVADMGAVLDALHGRRDVDSKRIGVTGFCMGGRLSFLLAREIPGAVKAVAPFYGGGIAGLLDRADRIQAPLYLFFGENDAFIPIDQVRQIERALTGVKKDFKVKVYPGAVHGFFCEKRDSYHKKSADDAWAELKAFFEKYLKS
jgi:carboxymethylenebutenolidase